jgi:hypothetical protein
MNLLHVSDDLAATVAAQMKAGKPLQRIARDMHISLEMATAAASRWTLLQRGWQQSAQVN